MTPKKPAKTLRVLSYLRVSTARQGDSGLGLEAQRASVAAWAALRGAVVVREFVEVESGRKSDRPQLAAALAQGRNTGAVVAVAKLDRLARDAAFVLRVLDSGAEFAACDLPEMQGPQARLMLTQFAAFAEYEARLISQRTTAALAVAKARGVRLGNPDGGKALLAYHACLRAQGLPVGTAAATAAAALTAAVARGDAAHALAGLVAEGFTSNRVLAAELNRRGVPATRGGSWHPTAVQRLRSAARQV